MIFLFTTQHELFIKRMLENEEQEKKGYELLLKKEYFAEFFDRLQAAGLFDVSRTLGPQPASEPGSVWIPYWSPLDYLEACGRLAGESQDTKLGSKVLGIVRSCAAASNPDGSPRHNYHTARKFAEILGFLPTSIVQISDVDLIPRWLSDPYVRGLVCSALDKGLMNGLLNSPAPDDWTKAVRILYHCTELGKGNGDDELTTVVDDYWLKELIDHHSSMLGEKAGASATGVFMERLAEIFGAGIRKTHGYLFRPAIEDHPQNHEWHGPENRCVEGLRDVLLSWVSASPETSKDTVSTLLHGELEIARRIAIHVINHRWSDLNGLFITAIGSDLFRSGHLHELYQLLSVHFHGMNAEQQGAVLDAIEHLSVSEITDDNERLRRIVQRNWLSALQGKGNERADQWYFKLGNGDDGVGVSPHPDFHSYMESSWGDGPSTYQPKELRAIAQTGSLVKVLNEFKQTDRWNGPTTRSLVNALEAAVAEDPALFVSCLPAFLHAHRPYQYGILNGLKQAWEGSAKTPSNLDWNDAWNKILGFLYELISPLSFWTEPIEADADFCPSRDWIPPVVADFLRAGTRDDKHAYPQELLPKALVLIEVLLERSEASATPGDDPMHTAINSPKGKAVEALFNHALRQCRVSDRAYGSHERSWSALQPIFVRELEKSKGQNFEFSTLAASYLANVQYMSEAWLVESIRKLFPSEFPDNFYSAIGGLAYSEPTKVIYRLLVDAGVVDFALQHYEGEGRLKNRLIERIALAYLWGDEELQSPRFTWWFDNADMHALAAVSHFFWSVSKQQINDKQVERIMQFWHRCIEVARRGNSPSDQLLSSLSRLACYVRSVGTNEETLLTSVAPYAHIGHNADWFIEALERLADDNPQAVSRLLNLLLNTHQPIFDFQDRLKSIARKFSENQMRDEALRLIDRLRRLRGMAELYDQLINARQETK
jgi:hypothetical protein